MNTIPGWNLGLRFLLELAAFAGLGFGAWRLAGGGLWGVVAVIVAVLAGATLWGVFAVAGDPSRSGKAPVPVPGWLRLALELLIFLGGAAGFVIAEAPVVGAIMVVLLGVHLAFSGGRLRWLVAQR